MNGSSIDCQSQVIWVFSLGEHLQKLGYQTCIQAPSREIQATGSWREGEGKEGICQLSWFPGRVASLLVTFKIVFFF